MAAAKVGNPAPDFDLATDGGGRVKLADFAGQKLVVYFYPADDTPGCTVEAVDFTRAHAAFRRAGAAVVGISPDGESAHDRFKAKHGIGFTLASDPGHETIAAYGAWQQKTMFGRKYMGVVRSTFLIGPDGKIVQEWSKVRVPGHVEAVLAAVKSLQVSPPKR